MSEDPVHVEDEGDGPCVVFLHGAPSPPDDMVALARAAAPGHRRLVPHMPGYDRTPPVDGAYHLDDVQRRVEATLAARGIAEVALVGYSLGAYQVLAIAVAGRLRVARLVLVGGFAAVAPGHRDALLGLVPVLAAAPDFADPALRGLMHGMLAPAFAAAHPEAIARVESWLDHTTPKALAAELGASALAPDLRDGLPGLRIPVTLIVGELDGSAPPDYSREIARSVPGASLHVLPGHGHALPVEAPARLAELVATALA
jgi:3-oxoadipate enol-lactonase